MFVPQKAMLNYCLNKIYVTRYVSNDSNSSQVIYAAFSTFSLKKLNDSIVHPHNFGSSESYVKLFFE